LNPSGYQESFLLLKPFCLSRENPPRAEFKLVHPQAATALTTKNLLGLLRVAEGYVSPGQLSPLYSPHCMVSQKQPLLPGTTSVFPIRLGYGPWPNPEVPHATFF